MVKMEMKKRKTNVLFEQPQEQQLEKDNGNR